MEKLILRYHWYIPYEAGGDEIIPFEYESKEQAYVDFMEMVEKAEWEVEFLGERIDVKFAKNAQFFTLDEWFEYYKLKY